MKWNIHPDRTLDLCHQAVIMGIVNVTPDSFSDGGKFFDPNAAIAHGIEQWKSGAGILDVGGESTRPGALAVDIAEEIRRVLPVIIGIRAALPDAVISIDTMKAEVADQALCAGASIINDVSGLEGDPDMANVAKRHRCGVVVMHMNGTPRTMQANPVYVDVVKEVSGYLARRQSELMDFGLEPEQMVFDPGIGFGKTLENNLDLLRNLHLLAPSARPLLLGVSRKSFIAAVLGNSDMEMRISPTLAITTLARQMGVMLHRVHDVNQNLLALRMTEAISGNSHSSVPFRI